MTSFVRASPCFEISRVKDDEIRTMTGLTAHLEVEGNMVEFGPHFPSFASLLAWSRERSVGILMRLDTTMFWVGNDADIPDGAVLLSENEADRMVQVAMGQVVTKESHDVIARRAEAAEVRRLRMGRGLSVEEFARDSGVPAKTIREIENCLGPYHANVATWRALAHTLWPAASPEAVGNQGWVVAQGGMLDYVRGLLLITDDGAAPS
jgi:DNA-binding XRE family transcriptional regulator